MPALVIHPFQGGVQDVEDPLTGRTGGLQHLIQAVQLPDWLIKECQIKDEFDQLTNLQCTRQNLPATHPENECGTQRSSKGHGWRINRPYPHDSKTAAAQII